MESKKTVDYFKIEVGNRVYGYKAVDVGAGGGRGCRGCDLSVKYGTRVVEEKVWACDRYACTRVCRDDGRDVVFRRED